MNIEQRRNEAQRKEKSAAKREMRRQPKGVPPLAILRVR